MVELHQSPSRSSPRCLATRCWSTARPIPKRRWTAHYRLRILNACQARFLNLQLYEDDGHGQPNPRRPGPDFLVIGTEAGFLARPVRVPSGVPINVVAVDPATGSRTVDPVHPNGTLITAPAERWDVVVDFTGKGGKKYILCNDAPAPYPMGDAVNDYYDPAKQVGQVLMRFEVKPDSSAIAPDAKFLLTQLTPLAGNPLSGIDKPLAGPAPAMPDESISWLAIGTDPLAVPTRRGIKVRQLTLNETFDGYGRLIQMLGTNVAPVAMGDFSRAYMDEPTETPKAGAVEVWQIANLTGDTHPIHFHLANAQVPRDGRSTRRSTP